MFAGDLHDAQLSAKLRSTSRPAAATLSKKRGFLNRITGITAGQRVLWTGYPDGVLILIAAVGIIAGQRLGETEMTVTSMCLLEGGLTLQ
jgi:hypothetical protein